MESVPMRSGACARPLPHHPLVAQVPVRQGVEQKFHEQEQFRQLPSLSQAIPASRSGKP